MALMISIIKTIINLCLRIFANVHERKHECDAKPSLKYSYVFYVRVGFSYHDNVSNKK